jgi:hypothetical protein
MKKLLIIKADTNDGDYVTAMHEVTEEYIKALEPVFKAISEFKPYRTEKVEGMQSAGWTHNHNWPCGNDLPRLDLGEKYPQDIYPQLSNEDVEEFNQLCPTAEYGIHTIVDIRVLDVADEKVYYEHKY